MKPYFYILRHISTGKLYVGSQYGKTSNPANLLETYFTSSKIIKSLIKKDGVAGFEVIELICRDDAREYEQQYLMNEYSRLGKREFMKLYYNQTLSPGILLTEEMIVSANEKRKVSNSIAAKRLFEEGRHNFQVNNGSKFDHVRKQSSERMKGNTYGSMRKMTSELKEKIANGVRGNQNVRGTIWVINDEGKRKRVSPNNIPEGFYVKNKAKT